MSEWIDVKQELPPTGKWCLVVWNGHVQRVAYKRVGHGFACADGYSWESAIAVGDSVMPDEDVTHWMPYPTLRLNPLPATPAKEN